MSYIVQMPLNFGSEAVRLTLQKNESFRGDVRGGTLVVAGRLGNCTASFFRQERLVASVQGTEVQDTVDKLYQVLNPPN